MKARHTTNFARRAMRCTSAFAALLLGACSTTTPGAKTAGTGTERHGQVKFTSATEQIVGDIVIKQDGDHFHAEITKGPGVPLLTISAKFGTDPTAKEFKEKQMIYAHLSGPLAHGGWTWRPKDLLKKKTAAEKLKEPYRAWGALPEVYMWAQAEATGEGFRVCLPDIIMHGRAGNGEAKRFDYTRHENPTGETLPIQDLRKQPKLETVICHLD